MALTSSLILGVQVVAEALAVNSTWGAAARAGATGVICSPVIIPLAVVGTATGIKSLTKTHSAWKEERLTKKKEEQATEGKIGPC